MSKELMSFYGTDNAGAWEEAFRLSDLLVKYGATDWIKVGVEQIRSEYVVVVTYPKGTKATREALYRIMTNGGATFPPDLGELLDRSREWGSRRAT